MANDTTAFKTELRSLLVNSANLDTATKTQLRNSYVAANPAQWQAFLAAGNADNATNRATFAIEMIFQDMRNVYRAGSQRENETTLPPPAVLA